MHSRGTLFKSSVFGRTIRWPNCSYFWGYQTESLEYPEARGHKGNVTSGMLSIADFEDSKISKNKAISSYHSVFIL